MPSSAPKIKKTKKPLRRGGVELYRDLQKRSMAARINRSFPLQFKLLPGAALPFRKRETDAGFDIAALENTIIPPAKLTFVRTGVIMCCPPGYWFHLAGRSSLNKEGVIVPSNVIDAGYTGEILVALLNLSGVNFVVHQGDRIAQAVFAPILHPAFLQVDDFNLDQNARGPKGFGSSGRNHAS